MTKISPLTVELSDEVLNFMRTKVASGEFKSESDLLNQAVETLRAEDFERNRWERDVLLPIHDHLMANPSAAIPLEEAEKVLEARRRQRLKAS